MRVNIYQFTHMNNNLFFDMRVLFLQRKPKNDLKGIVYIQCRITLNRKRCTPFSTGVACDPLFFNAKLQKITGNDLQNLKLTEIKRKIEVMNLDLENKGVPLTAETLKQYYLGKKVVELTLEKVLAMYLAHRLEMTLPNAKGKILLSMETYKADGYFANNLRLFLKEKGLTHTTPKEVTPKMCIDFYYWLQSAKSSGMTYAYKKSHQLTALMDYAVVEGFAPYNPLKSVKLKKDKKEDPISLEPYQVEILWNYKFENANLRKVADYALLQIYTSFAYSDLKSFDPSKDIQVDLQLNGAEFINKNRRKSGTKSLLPLLPRAKELIERYTNIVEGQKVFTLKVMTNSDYNKFLKVIEAIPDFNFGIPFTTHLFRRTYGCLRLYSGVDIFRVSKEMGHKNVQETIDNYAVLLRKMEMAKELGKAV